MSEPHDYIRDVMEEAMATLKQLNAQRQLHEQQIATLKALVVKTEQENFRLISENAALRADRDRLLEFAKLTMRGLAQGHIKAKPFMDMSDPNATEWPMRFLADEGAEVIAASIDAAGKGGTP